MRFALAREEPNNAAGEVSACAFAFGADAPQRLGDYAAAAGIVAVLVFGLLAPPPNESAFGNKLLGSFKLIIGFLQLLVERRPPADAPLARAEPAIFIA